MLMIETSPQQKLNKSSFLQVKIFSGNHIADAEKQVNDWLSLADCNIHHIGQSQCERNGSLLFVSSVFYYSTSNN
ncbi:MAG TPA: hypothetical protein VGC29_08435 [Flavisolibacter sp.]